MAADTRIFSPRAYEGDLFSVRFLHALRLLIIRVCLPPHERRNFIRVSLENKDNRDKAPRDEREHNIPCEKSGDIWRKPSLFCPVITREQKQYHTNQYLNHGSTHLPLPSWDSDRCVAGSNRCRWLRIKWISPVSSSTW
jgi:hypothetical protein